VVSDFLARATDAALTMTVRTRRKLIVALGVAVCALAALGFLTAALFIALANEIGAVGAAVCLAGVYAFAAVAIAYFSDRHAARARPHYDARPPSDTEVLAGVIAAFMTGFRATKGPGGKQRD
jgi:hypothetical protein